MTLSHYNMPLSSNPRGFTAYDDCLYFMADDGVHGHELWRLRSIPMIEIHAVAVGPDKFWEWPIDRAQELERQVRVATFVVAEGRQTRMIRQSEIEYGKGARNPRLLGARLDVDADRLPPRFALATVVFDAATGERLGQGIDVVGLGGVREGGSVQREADEFIRRLTNDQVRAW